MSRGGAAAVLLAGGGLLVAAGGFLPPGHEHAHWAEIERALDMLVNPDEPLSWHRTAFFGGKVAAFGYPMAAGLAFALAALLPRARATGAACFLVHAGGLWLLTLALLALAAARGEGGGGSQAGEFTLGALLTAALVAVEVGMVLAASPPGARPMPLPDRLNLPPAVFLLLLDAALFIYLLVTRNEQWPALGYPVGFLGAAAVVAGVILRRHGRGRPAQWA